MYIPLFFPCDNRVGPAKSSLQPPYIGPFRVIPLNEKYVFISKSTHMNAVIRERLKAPLLD